MDDDIDGIPFNEEPHDDDMDDIDGIPLHPTSTTTSLLSSSIATDSQSLPSHLYPHLQQHPHHQSSASYQPNISSRKLRLLNSGQYGMTSTLRSQQESDALLLRKKQEADQEAAARVLKEFQKEFQSHDRDHQHDNNSSNKRYKPITASFVKSGHSQQHALHQKRTRLDAFHDHDHSKHQQ
jgi:hypothetical protein